MKGMSGFGKMICIGQWNDDLSFLGYFCFKLSNKSGFWDVEYDRCLLSFWLGCPLGAGVV